jgi:O-antigen/teichoic acid export membrane protein
LYRYKILQLFGEEFTVGTIVLLLFSIAQLANSLGGPNGYLLMMVNRQRVLMINQWVFGVLNAVLNYILILEYGINGAAVATAGVLALLNIVKVLQLWHFEGLLPYSSRYLQPIFAGIISSSFMLIVRTVIDGFSVLFIGGIVGVIVYTIVLYKFGMSEKEYKLMSEFLP